MEKQAVKKSPGKKIQTREQSVRRIKVCKFTMRNELNDIEKVVNKEIDELLAAGHKVVSITNYVVNIPNIIYIIYNIIYESKETVYEKS